MLESLLKRRSCKAYKPDMVPEETIEKIIEAGTYAASGMGKQAAIIVAVTNKEVRDKLSKMNAAIMGANMDPFYGAPVVLAEGKEILKAAGVEGDYEGIGHLILGYPAADPAPSLPRKENYVYYVK